MLVSIERGPFANNVQTIIDRFGDSEHLKVALRKIAEEVEIVHLAFDPNERMLRTISDVRRPNNHSSLINPANRTAQAGNAVCTAERSEVSDVVTQLRSSVTEPEK